MFRSLALAAACLILGFVLGGLGPRRELHAAKTSLKAQQAACATVGEPHSDGGPLAFLWSRLDAARESGEPQRRGAPDSPAADGAAAVAKRTQHDSVVIGQEPADETAWRLRLGAVRNGLQGVGPRRQGSSSSDGQAADVQEGPRTYREGFELAAAGLLARAAQTRSVLQQQANLDAQQLTKVDAVVAKTNDKLAGYGEEFVQAMLDGKRPEPVQSLGFMHDVTGILHDGQVELEDALGPDAVAKVDPEARRIWNFTTLEAMRPVLKDLPLMDRAVRPRPDAAAIDPDLADAAGAAAPRAPAAP